MLGGFIMFRFEFRFEFRIASFIALSGIILSGCSSTNLQTPTVPTPIEIQQQAGSIQTVNIDPESYLNVGVELSGQQCAAYFDALAKQSDQLKFAGNQTNLFGGLATAIMGIAGSPASSVALAGVSAAALSQSINNYEAMSAGGLFPDETWSLVQKAQAAYLASAPHPSTKIEAMELVQGFSNQCSYIGIHNLARQAISSASATATTSGSINSNWAPRVQVNVPPRMIPPVVTAGH